MAGALTLACAVSPIDEPRRVATETIIVPERPLVAQAGQPDFNESLVLVAPDSPFYHRAGCPRLARKYRILTRREAKGERKSPCPICHPDRRG
jgi:hypothetical protein